MLQNTKGFRLIAAVTFCLLALADFAFSIRFSTLGAVLMLLGYILVVVPLFCDRRSAVTALGFLLMAAVPFATFLRYIAYGMSFASIFQQLISLLGSVCAALFAFALTAGCLSSLREQAKKVFFLPAAFSLIGWLLLLLGTVATLITGFGFWAYRLPSLVFAFFSSIVEAVALFFAMAYLAGDDTAETKQDVCARDETDYYCGLLKHILLLLFTLGIWQCIWIYRTTRFCNRLEGEKKLSPGAQLLLYLFVPFYSYYWTYKCAKRIDGISQANGLGSDLALLCMILAIFIGILPPILMQEQINTIVGVQRGTTRVSSAAYGVEQELRKYKDLLDKGLITPEEYEAKKKQLLGL